MTGESIIQVVIAIAGSSGVTHLLHHVRKSKKDLREDNLAWHTQLMIEQKDWRDMLLRQVDMQGREIATLRGENAELLKEVAELKARNEDLNRDNEEMEARVKELERELKKRDAAAEAVGL